MRRFYLVTIFSIYTTTAHCIAPQCSAERQDYVLKCHAPGTDDYQACLNQAFYNIELKIKTVFNELKKVGTIGAKFARQSYELQERYRITFCEGRGQLLKEDWYREGSPIRQLPPSQVDQKLLLQFKTECNVSIRADFLYHLDTMYCQFEGG